MKRALFVLPVGAALLAGIPAQAFWQSRNSNYNIAIASGATYTGPGDIQSGAALALSCSRAYNAAYAGSKGCNIRRASDNSTQDVNFLTNGNFDVAGYNTFVGADATASCTIAGTAVACTGASATLHVSDLITGTGITNPCLVTVTNGSTTATAVIAGTASTSCGTVSVAETVTFQVAGFITTVYDASGGGHSGNASQATAASQPQLLPLCVNSGTVPCIYGSGSTKSMTGNYSSTPTTTFSFSIVAERTPTSNSPQTIIGSNSFHPFMRFNTTSTVGADCDNSSGPTDQAATDAVLHAFQLTCVAGTNATLFNIDGTATTFTTTPSSWQTAYFLGEVLASTWVLNGFIEEVIIWPTANSTGTNSSLHTNDSAFYGTP